MAVNRDGTLSGYSPDDYFAVLSGKQQQAVASILAEKDRSVELSLLAAEVAAVLADDKRDVRRVEMKLHHYHLPKLDAAGLLEYCSEDRRVSPAKSLRTVVPPKTASLN
ncbi:DUF7344 domain-containing protein [Halopelagius longus]|uniref:DUF7344 domain-containing protein n=1 Tax=Halopelagius longus TaxID=1236180 RepID=A0A1H1FCW3_9EURY|nr:hypothetical protein [Halopelagius longus]RDI70163.1 hypothetical protein DWB78_16220 [Halopelagius longus]SDQ98757.1 hypothetical protein SAMN05216278_3141 [Halopelagius longus]